MKRFLNFLLALAFLSPASGWGAAPSWPSLAEQLRADGVKSHSALEALIAANQDFTLLRPDELKDKIRIPPWLRVIWRRAHPEGVYSAADPTGGYPFVLKEVREWMVSHQNLVPGPPERDADPDDDDEAAPPSRKVMVAGEKRISGLQGSPRSESDIRVNYWDPMKIISASNNISGGGSQAQFYSTDGGATWGQTTLSLQPGDAFHSDPTVEWTSDGTAWSTTIGINSGGSVLHMRAYKSTDNGATWTFDATFSGSQTSTDKQIIWVDHSATSPFKDNLYAIWHNDDPAFMNRRTGPAGSWQTPIRVSGAESTGTAIGADVKTNAFGDVFGFWPTTENKKVFVVKSTNGGASYGTPVQVATTFGSFDIGVPAMAVRRLLIYVSGGAYRTASKDLVYATWSDLVSACAEPGTNVASTCKSRVWFSRSTNGGGTWSAPVMINNQASLNDQFNQWLVVDETTGALEVVYYDTVADASRKKVDIWHQSSFDDGVTWSPAVKVTSAQTDETVTGANSGNQFGDYNSLSGIAGQFFPSWTDRRSSGREEIWTAKLTDTVCTAPGAPAIGTATATAPNQAQVSWANGSPASTTFNVYRATGSCASPGTFSRIATAVAGSPYTDGTVSGTITYAYQVKGLDATGICESGPSGCAQVTATGACTLPPSFAGLTSVTNPATATCGLTLAWTAAAPLCVGPVTYNVYRSTTAGFVPSPANRIATGVTGTGYTDTSGTLVSGVTYFYVVRAVDSSNGQEDGNSVMRSAAPTGTVTSTLTETFEGAGGFDLPGWSHAALMGSNDWALSTARSQSPTHSWFSASEADASERVLVSPSFVPQASSTLSFWHTFAFESTSTCFDAGTLEISTNGGSSWSVVPAAAFTAGGFNGTVSSGSSNPISGSRAWCGGTVGTLTQVTANLSSFVGSTAAKLRWHEGDDGGVATTGWFVDSVTLSNVGICMPSTPVQHGFFTVVPCRLVDTRNANGPSGGPSLQPNADRTFVMTGSCGVPSNAKALAVNVTVVSPTVTGTLNLFAADISAPATSAISFNAGTFARANNAIVGLPLDLSGGIKVRNSSTGTVQFLLDVVGYFQ
ncbi:MAG TPA: hypothetical protein VGS07_29280 [Thermoanaerobaculia bacterium]|jgi:hypothetical protein|nr:hypothetical protein [Thermoanaerobaculia bacterium]